VREYPFNVVASVVLADKLDKGRHAASSISKTLMSKYQRYSRYNLGMVKELT